MSENDMQLVCELLITFFPFYLPSLPLPIEQLHSDENTKTRLVCHDTTLILLQSIDRNRRSAAPGTGGNANSKQY